MMLILRSHFFKSIITATIFYGFVMSVNAQEAFVDNLTNEEFAQLKEVVEMQRRNNHPQNIELNNLTGSFQIVAECPSGYVKKANYQFNKNNLEITNDAGTDCDGSSCRAWHISAESLSEEVYDFTLKLQCTNDDLVTRDYFKRNLRGSSQNANSRRTAQ